MTRPPQANVVRPADMPPRTAYTIADLALAEKRVREGLIMIAEQHIKIEQSRVRGKDTSALERSLKTMMSALRIVVACRAEIETALLTARYALH